LRLKRNLFLLPLLLLAAPALRAEYVVLRSGQRLKVTGYQLVGDKYRLQMTGGRVEIDAKEVVAIEPEDVFTPIPATAAPQPLYRDLVEAAAKRYNLDPDLVTSVIAVESNFDPKAVSRKNAHGLMQLLPETAAQLGVKNIDDPAENIDAGSRYLKYLLQMYNGNLSLALAAYNAGPVKVQLYGSVPPYAETISYVRRVKRGYDKSKTETSKKTSAANAPAPRTPASPAAGLGTAPAFSPLAPGPGTAPGPSPPTSGARTAPASSPPPTGQPQ